MIATPLLVLGAPRSGTTLLAACLGRHSDVSMLNEDFGRAVRKLVGTRVVGNKLCVPNQIEWAQRGHPWLRELRKHGIREDEPLSAFSVRDYLSWPNARVVGIVRDGESVVSSIVSRGGQPLDVAVGRWARALAVLEAVRQAAPEQLLLVSFRGLVSAPEATLRRVAGHLGLSFEDRMLEGYAFTPLYRGASRIDARRAERRGPHLGVEALRPDAAAAYRRLLALCDAPLCDAPLRDPSSPRPDRPPVPLGRPAPS